MVNGLPPDDSSSVGKVYSYRTTNISRRLGHSITNLVASFFSPMGTQQDFVAPSDVFFSGCFENERKLEHAILLKFIISI